MTTGSIIRQRWFAGHGPIVHGDETVERMEILLTRLIAEGRVADETTAYTLLAAADRLSCVAMNVVAHMTYARRIDLSGAALSAEDFKPTPGDEPALREGFSVLLRGLPLRLGVMAAIPAIEQGVGGAGIEAIYP